MYIPKPTNTTSCFLYPGNPCFLGLQAYLNVSVIPKPLTEPPSPAPQYGNQTRKPQTQALSPYDHVIQERRDFRK
ncbi:hypothetical protein XENTR_v10024070 [Xenopus tropicalis]|nr:hypothetical protein XENTR_v10024070 [Xenopus tropicalis]